MLFSFVIMPKTATVEKLTICEKKSLINQCDISFKEEVKKVRKKVEIQEWSLLYNLGYILVTLFTKISYFT